RNHGWRSCPLKGWAAVGAVETHHPDCSDATRIVPQYPKIADQVTRRGGAVLSPPSIEGTDLFRTFEPVVADREERLRQIKLVRPAAPVVIHVRPVIGHQPIERIPQRHIIDLQHLLWFLPEMSRHPPGSETVNVAHSSQPSLRRFARGVNRYA